MVSKEIGPLLPGVADRCLTAITRLVESRIRQTNEYRPRQPGADVGLHLDNPALQADKSHLPCAGRSHSTHRPDVGDCA